MEKFRRRCGLALGLFGVVVALIATVMAVQHVRFEHEAVHAAGKVIGHESHATSGRDDNGGTMRTRYSSIVVFEVPGDQFYTFTDHGSASAVPRPRVGARVEVLYPRRAPLEARVNHGAMQHPVPLIGGFGVVFMVVGLGISRIRRRSGEGRYERGSVRRPTDHL